MIRNAFLQSLRQSTKPVTKRHLPTSRTVAAPCLAVPFSRCSIAFKPLDRRYYSAPAGLSKPEVEGRIMDLLKNFDKIKDASKLSGTSHFSNDLGLDSLDTVEVVMAIEEEFSIEIPDKEADAILSIDKAVNYILGQPDAH
ncbi:Vacuolar protein sorting-associated protein 74 [Lecanora helva]